MLNSSPFYVLLLLISFLVNSDARKSSVFASSSLHRQEEKAVWETYTASGEEFSVLMPELPGVLQSMKCFDVGCRTKRVDKTYAAYSNGVVYLITSYQDSRSRQSLAEIIAETWGDDEINDKETVKSDVILNKFTGKQFIIVSKIRGYDILATFYLTDKHVYEVRAVGGSRHDSAVQEFFKSFTLGSKKGKDIGDGGRRDGDSIAAPAAPKVDAQVAKDDQSITALKPGGVTHKAVIILKPSPGYTEEARQHQVSGTAVLQMVFASSGRVTNIRTISGLPRGLTEMAIRAARKIYFLPAVKDGKRVSQYIRVEYNFNIY